MDGCTDRRVIETSDLDRQVDETAIGVRGGDDTAQILCGNGGKKSLTILPNLNHSISKVMYYELGPAGDRQMQP